MNIEIVCNEKGAGKTTFAKGNFTPHVYLTDEIWEENGSGLFSNTNTQSLCCIIDSVDSIPSDIFKDMINVVLKYEWITIVIIFDITNTHLMDCQNFNMIWTCNLLSRNYKYQNYIADKSSLYLFLQTNYPDLSINSYENILDITGNNFRKIDRLMFLNGLHTVNTENIDPKALAKYISEIIQTRYKDIPDAEILLEKASIIGEQFACDALESPKGFGCEAAHDYLVQMEEMHGFIRKCIDLDSQFEFVSHDIYFGIFNSITNENKKAWVKILIQYYKYRYEHCTSSRLRISLLNKLKNLNDLLYTYSHEKTCLNFRLLFEYRQIGNIYKALETASEIAKAYPAHINITEYAFIQNYRISTFMEKGEYKPALEILQQIMAMDKYPGSKMFIKYYYALCLYQTGNVDKSFEITVEIIDYLKKSSGYVQYPQELFCMTYSLMATIQNHLGIEDGGIKYYYLALNNAQNKLGRGKHYYDILKKCDMFFGYIQSKIECENCLQFYTKRHDWISVGEVSINLATEMLFQDCNNPTEIKQYFKNALLCFEEFPNEKLAYARNNIAIYYIIFEHDIEKGLKTFKDALLVGLSDYTYMTIYLNICMCYILLKQLDSAEFLDAKTRFKLATKKLQQRHHESLYEKTYEALLDIIIKEHQGGDVLINCQNLLESLAYNSFFIPLVKDIIERNSSFQKTPYKNNMFYYSSMNSLKCFLAEFRFWE